MGNSDQMARALDKAANALERIARVMEQDRAEARRTQQWPPAMENKGPGYITETLYIDGVLTEVKHGEFAPLPPEEDSIYPR